ncbi:hypothetical protein D5086_022344 [Populus alba]|uniref:Uncharacterized protein n=1 Tax=Populus alba TaxID=43335 RepID=A0ACC4BFA3_POPAL
MCLVRWMGVVVMGRGVTVTRHETRTRGRRGMDMPPVTLRGVGPRSHGDRHDPAMRGVVGRPVSCHSCVIGDELLKQEIVETWKKRGQQMLNLGIG